MNWLNGKKTNIGIAAGTVLAAVVMYFAEITWETPWVQVVTLLIGSWTGFAARSAIKKGQNG